MAAISWIVPPTRRSPVRKQAAEFVHRVDGSSPTTFAYARTHARAYSPRGHSDRSFRSKASSRSRLNAHHRGDLIEGNLAAFAVPAKAGDKGVLRIHGWVSSRTPQQFPRLSR